jgi:hypothetical protein
VKPNQKLSESVAEEIRPPEKGPHRTAMTGFFNSDSDKYYQYSYYDSIWRKHFQPKAAAAFWIDAKAVIDFCPH